MDAEIVSEQKFLAYRRLIRTTSEEAMAKKKPDIEARVLSPSEYPASITATRGAYTPKIVFAAEHPLGLYYVEDQGAGHLGTFFLSRRAKHAKTIGGASSIAGAFRRISKHEDELIHPGAEREEGKRGPVSIYAIGERTGETKPKSHQAREPARSRTGRVARRTRLFDLRINVND